MFNGEVANPKTSPLRIRWLGYCLNNYSIVIKMTFGTTSFLFTGDAQEQSEAEMLAKGITLKPMF